MNKTSIIHTRIEPQVKTSAERVLHKLGLNPTEAIRMFYRQIILRNGLPFQVHLPNALTEDVLAKSRRGEEVEHFDSADALFASWEK